jgi:hypothetical protein
MTPRKTKDQTAQDLRDSDIDQASAASFPASDPPPWTLGSEARTVTPPPPTPAAQRGRAVVTTLPGLGPPNVQGDAEIAAGFDVPADAAPEPTATVTDVTASRRRAVGRPRQRANTVALARLQGGYFAVTGLWPLLHMRSFRYVTGGKTVRERWLVKTVGVLVASIGATLVASATKGRRPDSSIRLLATTSALGLLAIDVWYAAKRRISPIYLLGAAAEAALAVAWSVARAPEAKR